MGMSAGLPRKVRGVTMELGSLVLWGIGIVIAVVLAFIGAKKISNRQSQRAKAGSNSQIVQSGRNTTINDREAKR
jgi:hypothetical protein